MGDDVSDQIEIVSQAVWNNPDAEKVPYNSIFLDENYVADERQAFESFVPGAVPRITQDADPFEAAQAAQVPEVSFETPKRKPGRPRKKVG